MKNTKDNPGGYQSLIGYLAELENTDAYKTVEFKTIQEAKKSVRNFDIVLEKMGVKFVEPHFQLRKGGEKVLCVKTYIDRLLPLKEQITAMGEQKFIDLPEDSHFDRISATIQKGLNDFKTIPQYCGKAKICEGGGWYSWGSLYRVGDCYFEF